MLCPKCKVEAVIAESKPVILNDDTPYKETQLFIEQTFKCRNPNCESYGKVIGTVKNQVSLKKDTRTE